MDLAILSGLQLRRRTAGEWRSPRLALLRLHWKLGRGAAALRLDRRYWPPFRPRCARPAAGVPCELGMDHARRATCLNSMPCTSAAAAAPPRRRVFASACPAQGQRFLRSFAVASARALAAAEARPSVSGLLAQRGPWSGCVGLCFRLKRLLFMQGKRLFGFQESDLHIWTWTRAPL